jgi:chorismate mutase
MALAAFPERLSPTITREVRMDPRLEAARARLAARLKELNAEIRAYPQPIARCDAQLGGLVEERARIQSELAAIERAQGDGEAANDP